MPLENNIYFLVNKTHYAIIFWFNLAYFTHKCIAHGNSFHKKDGTDARDARSLPNSNKIEHSKKLKIVCCLTNIEWRIYFIALGVYCRFFEFILEFLFYFGIEIRYVCSSILNCEKWYSISNLLYLHNLGIL